MKINGKSKHEEFSELAIHWADIAREHATIAADAARAGRAAYKAIVKIEAGRLRGFSYKAALEKIRIVIDDMPQLERWHGAMGAAKGFKQICDVLKEALDEPKIGPRWGYVKGASVVEPDREAEKSMKGLHIYNVTVIRQGNSGSAKFDFIYRDERHSSNNWVTREIRDFCNKTLGESKAEPDYKAALEEIRTILGNEPRVAGFGDEYGREFVAAALRKIYTILRETP